MSYDSEIETTPLVYDSNKDCSTVKNVLFINQSVGEFSQYVNNDTFAIQYSFTSSSTELMEILRSRFSLIERIGFVFHYSPQASFMDLEYLFVPSDFTGGSMSKGLEIVLEILLDFDVQHVDFLACKTLLDTNWRQYFDLLKGNSNAVVSASDDNTGNLKYGGDWILENTMTDVKTIYFNDLLENFASLLDTYTENYITYTYSSGTGLAKVTGLDDSVGHFTIPSKITIDGTEYDVNEIGENNSFVNASYIISLTFTGTSDIELYFVYSCFSQCQNLVECNMEQLNRNVKFDGDTFNRCHSLTTFVFPNNLACNFYIGSFAFQSCSSLHRLDFTCTITDIGWFTFRNDQTSTYTYTIDLYFYQTTALPTMGWGDNVAIQNMYYIEGVDTTNVPSDGESLLAIWAPPVPLNIEPLPLLVNNQYSFTQLSTNDLTQTDIVGSTTAEQKTHLKDILKEIYTTHTDLSGYDFILKSGSVLPGYSTSLTTDIGIYNAAKSISNSYLDTIQFDTLKDTSFFVLMDLSGDTVTLPSGTENYNITITQISDVSFSITSPIETVIKAVDDSFSYNGLSIILGSVFGTLVANEVPLFPTIPFISHTYYNVFYTVSKNNPSVLNAKFYDQSQTLISTQDISFNGKTMKEMLAFLENSAANPYAIGKTRTGFRSMDLTYGAVYKKALKDSQQQSLMTYVNKTFKNVYSSAITTYEVKVNGSMKYMIDDVEQPNLVATQIGTYVFDQSDPSNDGHRLKFRNLSDSTTQYTTNVTHEGTPGTPNSYSIIDVTQSTPDLEYYCENHTSSMYGEFKTLTDLTSYRVKVETNVLGDPVFSLSPPGTDEYYNQIDVSFGAGSKFLFDVSDPTMADISFVFGTVVDNSSTIIDSFVTYQDGVVILDICSGYVGESLKYFEDTSAGMGYVRATITETQVNLLSDWTQLGSDIDGEAANDIFGLMEGSSLSSDGKTIALSGIANGNLRGHVRLYTYNGTIWTQKGSDIDGEATHDYFGMGISLSSDGNTVAIGALLNDGNGTTDSGHTRVYTYSNNTWTQKGSDIDGEAAGDNAGVSVSLSSDGNTVAIGAHLNDGNGTTNSGHVRVYTYSNNTWTQKGSDIDGEAANDESGISVSLSSDGNIVAIGAPLNDGNGSDSGHVRIFEWKSDTSSWSQLGSDIDGKTTGDNFGSQRKVNLSSDGHTVAISSQSHNSNRGYAQVYTYNNNTWVQKGSDINGDIVDSYYGASVTLSSDGNIIAIGATFGANTDNPGYVSVFQYINNTWTQLGTNIQGEANGDRAGEAISLSSDGLIVAVGALYNDENGTNSGHARVFTIKEGEVEIEVEAPTFTVTVSGDTAVFYIDGSANPQLTFTSGETYVFDLSHNSNAGNTFVLGTLPDSSTNLIDYQTIVGTPGQPGAYTSFTASGETVFYYSFETPDMGYEPPTYIVKTEINVLGDTVFSIQKPDENVFYTQPDLSFGAGFFGLFNVAEIDESYNLVFGTEVDVSSTIQTQYFSQTGDFIVLSIPSDYSGNSLKYFENTNAGMGYVEASLISNTISSIFNGVTEPKFYWDYRTNTPESDATSDYVLDVMNVDGTNLKARSVNNLVFSDISGPRFNTSPNYHIKIDPFTFGGKCSIETYYYLESFVSHGRAFDFAQSNTDDSFYLSTVLGDDNKPYFAIRDVQSIYLSYGSDSMELHTWYQTVITVDENGSVEAYINKNDQGLNFTASNPNIERASNLVGSTNFVTDGTQNLDGHIAYTRIWQDHVLTTNEISKLYDSRNIPYGFITNKIYTVTVSGDPAVFYIDGSANPQLTFTPGETYVFDQSDTTNAGNTFVLGTVPDSSTNLIDYQTIFGTPGQPGAYTSFTASGETVFYYSFETPDMGYEPPTYIVKTEINVLGDTVFSIQKPDENVFYTQPDLSFGAGFVALFDVAHIGSYSLVFGTEVDVSSTIQTQYYSQTGGVIVLSIPSDYSGDSLKYFEDTTAGMGYVIATITETQVNLLSDWTQLGSDIDGDAASDRIASSTLSSDGLTLAYGSYTNGYIRVKRYINGSWTSLGNKITGTGEFGKMYVSLSSDGNTVATGASGFYTSVAGKYAAVYRYNTSTNVWDQLGSDISGTGDLFGFSVKLTPDGNTIAVGSKDSCVEVFEYNSSTTSWVQKGSDLIPPDEHTSFGYNLDITPDGNKVVVTGGRYASVWTYSNNAWSHNSTIDTTYSNGTVGLAMSDDGNTVVCGANDSSLVKVFSFANNTWSQLGSNISSTSGTQFGVRCRISSDGSIIAISANLSDIGGTDSGHVAVYEYTGSNWTQKGSNIVGEAEGDNCGGLLGLSDDGLTVSIVSIFNDGGGYESGHVRVFTIKEEIEVEAPTFTVTVSGDPAVFYIDGSANPQLTFTSGTTYVFDLSHNSNAGNTLVLGTVPDSSTNLIDYQTIVGTPGQSGAYTSFTASGETVYYYSFETPDMGYKPPTYTVTVSGDPVVFYIDDVSKPQLTFTAGETYIFVQSHSSNTGHPLVIGTTADDNTTLVSQTAVGTPGQPGAYTSFTATADDVYYFCYNHSEMGYIPPPPSITIELLLIGGGGAGGYNRAGGGGGAGGMVTQETTIYIGVPNNITIGKGGSHNSSHTNASGEDSIFSNEFLLQDISAVGGGYGLGYNGGSGGGGAAVTPSTGGLSTANQGHDGGDFKSDRLGGGGGGAGSIGETPTDVSPANYAGRGGDGATWAVDGNVYAGGGGGGAAWEQSAAGGSYVVAVGGSGIGGSGARGGTQNREAGTAPVQHTGSGGGGGGGYSHPNGNKYIVGSSGANGVIKVWLPITYTSDSSHVTGGFDINSISHTYNSVSGTLVTITSPTMSTISGTWTVS